MKRYAIVRVDKYCPSHFEKIENLDVCAEPLRNYMNKLVHCKNCRYGDTKEQLILKIAQVLKRKADLSNYNKKGAKFCYNLHFKYCEDLAKEIVEFLGVLK